MDTRLDGYVRPLPVRFEVSGAGDVRMPTVSLGRFEPPAAGRRAQGRDSGFLAAHMKI